MVFTQVVVAGYFYESGVFNKFAGRDKIQRRFCRVQLSTSVYNRQLFNQWLTRVISLVFALQKPIFTLDISHVV